MIHYCKTLIFFKSCAFCSKFFIPLKTRKSYFAKTKGRLRVYTHVRHCKSWILKKHKIHVNKYFLTIYYSKKNCIFVKATKGFTFKQLHWICIVRNKSTLPDIKVFISKLIRMHVNTIDLLLAIQESGNSYPLRWPLDLLLQYSNIRNMCSSWSKL